MQEPARKNSNRLPIWDYSNEGVYFVTICLKIRRLFFGRIRNGKMELNSFGLIVEDEWNRTPEIRPDQNLILGEYVVMPDHFHGIIQIGENDFNRNSGGRGAMHRVSHNPPFTHFDFE